MTKPQPKDIIKDLKKLEEERKKKEKGSKCVCCVCGRKWKDGQTIWIDEDFCPPCYEYGLKTGEL